MPDRPRGVRLPHARVSAGLLGAIFVFNLVAFVYRLVDGSDGWPFRFRVVRKAYNPLGWVECKIRGGGVELVSSDFDDEVDQFHP